MTNNKTKEGGFGRITAILLSFILVSILLPTILAGYLSISSQRKHYESNLEQDRERLIATLSATLASPVWNVREDQIDQIVSSFMGLPYLLEVSVFDEISGKLIYQKKNTIEQADGSQIKESRDIVSHERVVGTVEVICSSDYYDEQLKSDIKELVLLFVFLFVATSLLVSMVVFRFLLSPLLDLIQHSLKTEIAMPDELDGWGSPIEKIQKKIVFLLNEFERYYQIVDKNTITLRLDKNGNVLHSSVAFTELFGLSPEEIKGKGLETVCSSQKGQERIRQGLVVASQDGIWSEELNCRTENGNDAWLFCTITAERSSASGTGFVVVCKDITDKKVIEKIAVTDKLTGLYNRVKIDEQLANQFELYQRYNIPVSCMLIDLDHFKQVNDEYGHPTGDKVLKKVSALLKENIRKTDVLGRWGGEEFILICPSTELSQCMKVAEHLRKIISDAELVTDVKTTCSIGVGALIPPDESIETFVSRVDKALYLAKSRGRNKVYAADGNP